jgi:hypothetical protein
VIGYRGQGISEESSSWKPRLIGLIMMMMMMIAASIKMAVFWDVAPCSLVEIDRRFRSSCYIHHQGQHSMFIFIVSVRTVGIVKDLRTRALHSY